MLVNRRVRGLENTAEDTSWKKRDTIDLPHLDKRLLCGNLALLQGPEGKPTDRSYRVTDLRFDIKKSFLAQCPIPRRGSAIY